MTVQGSESREFEAPIDRVSEIAGLLVGPIAARVRRAVADGKISDEELDDTLSFNARAILDASNAQLDWVPLDDFESLLAAASTLLGDEPAIADFAEQVVDGWIEEPEILSILDASLDLVDAPGFVVAQASERLVRDSRWSYLGGRTHFSVEISGLADASIAARILLGATLARLAECPWESMDDVRFEGVDEDALRIFGSTRTKRKARSPSDSEAEGRVADQQTRALHRAALIG